MALARAEPTASLGADSLGKNALPPPTTRVRILVEIVGATNLSPHPELSGGIFLADGDCQASSFVKVTWGDDAAVLHTTDSVPGSNDPIWAVDTGSLFLLDATLGDLVGGGERGSERGGAKPKVLTFELRDKDTLLGNTAQLGTVRIKADRLLESCNEERVEFNILGGTVSAVREEIMEWDDGDGGDGDEDGRGESDGEDRSEKLAASLLCAIPTFDEREEDDTHGKLALRFRLATEDDLRFMTCLKNGSVGEIEQNYSGTTNDGAKGGPRKVQSSGLITDKDEGVVGVQGMLDSLNFTFNSTTTDQDGKVKMRVKPGPDPQRPERTTFLSEAELLAAAYSPSKNWIEAGSGKLGRMFVEILRCEGLPNMDAGGAVGNKTDAFVSLAYEDIIVQSDRIDDSLSPLWMPWSQRAFAFNRTHPSSSLYVAVFDYDLGPTDHDGIGRVAINLEHFKPDTVYTLTYKLYSSSTIMDREPMGSITIRLCMETPDEKACLIETIKQTPRMHINVKKEKSLSVAKYTCYGQYDEDKYDMKLLRSYINEIVQYKTKTTYVIGDALRSLLLWRGQVKIGALNLPLHSMAAFIIGTYVVERPHLVPSLCCFCLAWFMLASYGYRVQHPSPWHRCKPITDYISILRYGKAPPSSNKIYARQGAKEAEALEQAWENRLQADMDAANKRWELQQELNGIGDEAIHTEQSGLQIDPLARLFPVQRRLRGVCYVFRLIKCVLTWEDSATSFWITATSIGLGVALFILPTVFLLHWLCRFIIWTFLGPWMKLVDWTFLSRVDFENDEERRKHKENTVKDLVKSFKEMRIAARIKGEDALKLKSMRMLRFGQFIARVPSRNVTRHYDYPLPDSTAVHVKRCPTYPVPAKGWDDRNVTPGQKLHGSMIPVQGQFEASYETNEQLALLQKIGAENREKVLRKKLEGDTVVSASTTSTGGGDNNDIKEEEGFEIELSDAILQSGKTEQVIPVALEGSKPLYKIDEGDEENETSRGKMSSLVDVMLVPSHITSASESIDDTSVSSSMGMETAQTSASSNEDDASCCSEDMDADDEVKGLLAEEGVEVLARCDELFSEGAVDDRAEQSDKSRESPVYQTSDGVCCIFIDGYSD